MKSDLDALMKERDLQALLVTGPGQNNPPMVYLAGIAHMTDALLVKKRDQAPVLFCRAMERDEAAKNAARNGVEIRSIEDFKLHELLKEAKGDMLQAVVKRLQLALNDLEITSGRVAINGAADSGEAYAFYSALQAAMPELTLVGEFGDTLLAAAQATKDDEEIKRIRRMGQITTSVMGQVADFLTSHQVKDQALVKAGGAPLTIGEVKSKINLWLAERGASNPHGTIFANGWDAGVPHSSGTDSEILKLGQTIVFDIFPCEAGGGYHYDVTRTWCLGYASDEALALYEDVHTVYQQVMSELRLDAPFGLYQGRACEIFQAQGHPTMKDSPQTLEGYVHGLGHGLGLHIHERPFSRLTPSESERLLANSVVTIEPGLYYPERGLGMRLEDTVWMRPDGQAEILAPYPLDLVLPVK